MNVRHEDDLAKDDRTVVTIFEAPKGLQWDWKDVQSLGLGRTMIDWNLLRPRSFAILGSFAAGFPNSATPEVRRATVLTSTLGKEKKTRTFRYYANT